MIDKPDAPKSIGQWIGDSLGVKLPEMPQTVRNLDKAAAALMDIPTAYFETKADYIRNEASREDRVANALAIALEKRLKNASTEEISAHLDGLVGDYLEKQAKRRNVLVLAAEELSSGQKDGDSKSEISDDWMAFFKGKVDSLGSDEAQILFSKVLAGEVKQPGFFSKKALSILAEMDQRTGSLFDKACGISCAGQPFSLDLRILTLGLGNAGQNSLQNFGLSFDNLNILQEAGLIIADYNSYAPRPHGATHALLEIGGQLFKLIPQDGKFANIDQCLQALSRLNGVAFTAAGRELRSIVALKPNAEYIQAIEKSFQSIGFGLQLRA